MVRYRKRFPRPIFKETIVMRVPISLKQKIYYMCTLEQSTVSDWIRKVFINEFEKSKYKGVFLTEEYRKFQQDWVEDYKEVRDLKKLEKKEQENG